jgi:RHS repeat-associated protein
MSSREANFFSTPTIFTRHIRHCGRFDEGSRTGGYAGMNYSFLTLKERDVETGLDYFQARYYSNIMGRFTSVDPYDPITLGDSNNSRDYYILQPQNGNRYTYGLNNPPKMSIRTE